MIEEINRYINFLIWYKNKCNENNINTFQKLSNDNLLKLVDRYNDFVKDYENGILLLNNEENEKDIEKLYDFANVLQELQNIMNSNKRKHNFWYGIDNSWTIDYTNSNRRYYQYYHFLDKYDENNKDIIYYFHSLDFSLQSIVFHRISINLILK